MSKKRKKRKKVKLATVDRSGIETWTLARDDGTIMMTSLVPPGHGMVFEQPLWWAGEKVSWWVTRTLPANQPAPKSTVKTLGSTHVIENECQTWVEPEEELGCCPECGGELRFVETGDDL